MAYDSRVYRILIASPSDVDEEREMAVNAIQAWNDLHSYTRRITLLPLRWETHTAPEYGTRPQEVINRAIVDECDLLVGIFWTRIGSPTGVADSGTLEEIERVGKAKKPIMLYFSSVGADPAQLNTDQLLRLQEFRHKTYPNGLIESYKSLMEFREKFSMHLERKVRELQHSESAGHPPLALDFIALETGAPVGSVHTVAFERAVVTDFSAVPEKYRAKLQERTERQITAMTYVPMPLVISNPGSSSVRNLYVELSLSASDETVAMTERPIGPYVWRSLRLATYYTDGFDGDSYASPIRAHAEEKLAKFSASKLQRVSTGWQLSFAWDAVQAQRQRLIRPVVYVAARQSAQVLIHAKVFADTAPGPFTLAAQLHLVVTQRRAELEELLPHWKEELAAEQVEEEAIEHLLAEREAQGEP